MGWDRCFYGRDPAGPPDPFHQGRSPQPGRKPSPEPDRPAPRSRTPGLQSPCGQPPGLGASVRAPRERRRRAFPLTEPTASWPCVTLPGSPSRTTQHLCLQGPGEPQQRQTLRGAGVSALRKARTGKEEEGRSRFCREESDMEALGEVTPQSGSQVKEGEEDGEAGEFQPGRRPEAGGRAAPPMQTAGTRPSHQGCSERQHLGPAGRGSPGRGWGPGPTHTRSRRFQNHKPQR